jgi:aspartokinase
LELETRRGISEVEVRHGFAQIHLDLGREDLAARRISLLGLLADAGISHKYLQLTRSGLAFIITEEQVDAIRIALDGRPYELNLERSIVLVNAVGMREERGMIASILQAAIASGVQIDHIGDMHNKMFMVVRGDVAEETAERFREQLSERGSGG